MRVAVLAHSAITRPSGATARRSGRTGLVPVEETAPMTVRQARIPKRRPRSDNPVRGGVFRGDSAKAAGRSGRMGCQHHVKAHAGHFPCGADAMRTQRINNAALRPAQGISNDHSLRSAQGAPAFGKGIVVALKCEAVRRVGENGHPRPDPPDAGTKQLVSRYGGYGGHPSRTNATRASARVR